MEMGQAEGAALYSLLTGNIALFIGLLLTLCGLYQMLVARNTGYGIIMLAVGLCLSLLPNIMGGLQAAFCPIVQTLGGQCANFGTASGSVAGTGGSGI